MKTRAEYREVFSSPTVFTRVLHTLSTQKYKLPVRRYILDLFDLQLDVETVKVLVDARKAIRVMPSMQDTAHLDAAPPMQARVPSVIGRPGRSRRVESDDDSDEEDVVKAAVPDRPVMNLRPVSRIIGFQ